MDSEFWRWYAIFTVLWGSAAGLIGVKRGGPGFVWFLVAQCSWPFGLQLPLLLAGRPCPHRRNSIIVRAVICSYCRSSLTQEPDYDPAEAADQKHGGWGDNLRRGVGDSYPRTPQTRSLV